MPGRCWVDSRGRVEDTGLCRGTVLGADFFARPSDEVAPDLIGKILWSPGRGGGRLTEVEAYLPAADPASHSACGPTKRNAAMFGPPGTIYVFLSYGVHYLLNIVCDRQAIGSAVLVRAFESVRGPGRVGKALGVHPGMNGLTLGEASGLFVMDDGTRPDVGIATRIGISRGDSLLLRYYSLGSRWVTGRPATKGGTCT